MAYLGDSNAAALRQGDLLFLGRVRVQPVLGEPALENFLGLGRGEERRLQQQGSIRN